jgi:hypothetical protein
VKFLGHVCQVVLMRLLLLLWLVATWHAAALAAPSAGSCIALALARITNHEMRGAATSCTQCDRTNLMLLVQSQAASAGGPVNTGTRVHCVASTSYMLLVNSRLASHSQRQAPCHMWMELGFAAFLRVTQATPALMDGPLHLLLVGGMFTLAVAASTKASNKP